jgi:hypothetical protein
MKDDEPTGPAAAWTAASQQAAQGAPPDAPEDREPTPEEAAQMAAAFQQMMAPQQAWRPACCNCLNNHKIAIQELAGKLKAAGIVQGMPEFMQAMQSALEAGAQMAQNPFAMQGQNGTHPDLIPPVRPADVFVNGNTVCMVCFTPMKQSGLLAAGAGWRPGG